MIRAEGSEACLTRTSSEMGERGPSGSSAPVFPSPLSWWPSLCPPDQGTAGKLALAVDSQGN